MKISSIAITLNPLRTRSAKIGVLLLGCVVSTPAMAVTDSNVTITDVGAQMGSGGFIKVSPAASGNCLYNTIYIDTSTDAGRSILAIALTARASARPISRIDYTVASGGTCNATLIQL